jgi:hypothetical protein
MAARRDLQPPDESDRLERLGPPDGYRLGKDCRPEDVLALQAELLRSEGIDPNWPGLEQTPRPASKRARLR